MLGGKSGDFVSKLLIPCEIEVERLFFPLRGFDIVLAHEGLEIGPQHSHVPGGAGDIPFVAGESGQDEEPLDFFNGFVP